MILQISQVHKPKSSTKIWRKAKEVEETNLKCKIDFRNLMKPWWIIDGIDEENKEKRQSAGGSKGEREM